MAAMFDKEYLKKVAKERKKWESETLNKSLERFKITENPNRFREENCKKPLLRQPH